MTGADISEALVKEAAPNISAVLRKPFSVEEILNVMENVQNL